MDRRALPGVAAGIIGLALGVSAALFAAPALAVIAGIVALVAGVLATRFALAWHRSRQETRTLQASVEDLTEHLHVESKRRADAEAKLSSRIQLTAMRRGTEANVLTDGASGLLSEGYFTVALDARISTARRNLKPVAVVLIEVITGLDSPRPKPADPARVAESINATIRESDTACRLLDGGYALVLEDTSENGAIWTVERIRRHMASNDPGLTMWAGVACYPAHGFTTDEVLDRADLALDMAREWRQDRIEVASAE